MIGIYIMFTKCLEGFMFQILFLFLPTKITGNEDEEENLNFFLKFRSHAGIPFGSIYGGAA